MADDFHLNGQDTVEAVEETESLEELTTVRKKLRDLAGKGPDGELTKLTKQDIGLLKQLIHAPDTDDNFIKIVQICDFLDEDERNRELDAYFEAVRLGMETDYNIAHALSCGSINRKGAHNTSISGSLLDALSHQKLTSNVAREKAHGSPRSPLS